MNNGKRGRPLPYETLTVLEAKIDEVLEDEWAELPDDEKDWDFYDRYHKNPQDVEARKYLISKIGDKCGWIMELASQLMANEKTIRKYVNDPKLLRDKIEKLAKGNGTVRVLDGISRQVFVEAVRLLSATVDDLVNYMSQNYLHAPHPLFKPANDRPLMERCVSRKTFENEARLCFDLTGRMTIKQMMADSSLIERVEKNLRNWKPKTIGVHAVRILWQVDHGESESREEWVESTLLLMAERNNDKGRHIEFDIFPIDATSESKSYRVKKFIKSYSTRLVRLTSDLQEGEVKPTALDHSVLKEILGNKIKVEVDEATRGLGVIIMPGKFPTQDDLKSELKSLLDRKYAKKERDKKLKINWVFKKADL